MKLYLSKHACFSLGRVLAVLLLSMGPGAVLAATVQSNWWGNQTASANVYNSLSNQEGALYLGNATYGFIEGKVSLPMSGEWHFPVSVKANENPLSDPGDYVQVFINGNLQGAAPAADFITVFNMTTYGPNFTYRFEFFSNNADENLHQIIFPTTITSVPVPAAEWLFASTLLGLGSWRRFLVGRESLQNLIKRFL